MITEKCVHFGSCSYYIIIIIIIVFIIIIIEKIHNLAQKS